jgi:hypothetical protein
MCLPDLNTCRPRLMHGTLEPVSCNLQLSLLLVTTSNSIPIAALCRLSAWTGSAESLGSRTQVFLDDEHTAVFAVQPGMFEWKDLFHM